MESNEVGVVLLENKYNLQSSPEVDQSADRTTRRKDEEVSQEPYARIGNYLERFHEILDREDPVSKEHGIKAAKRFLYGKFAIKPENVPESYFENQRRLAREQGFGDIEITKDVRDHLSRIIISDQKSSIDRWVDYLSSDDAPYSDGFKYYALRSILSMGAYDKKRHSFAQRTHDTIAPFPELNPEALGMVIDIVARRMDSESEFARIDMQIRQTRNKIKELSNSIRQGNNQNIEEIEAYQELLNSLRKEEDMLLKLGDKYDPQEQETEDDKRNRLDNRSRFHQDVQKANFSQLYAWALEKINPATEEQLSTVEGKWVKYDKGSDHLPLFKSLQGHGTGWCTASGEKTAETQVKGGDFYVFYSLDSDGQAKVPRVAIRMHGSSIAEIRGIAEGQNLDRKIGQVVSDKLKEFPDGESYQKTVSDMKYLTQIEQKMEANQELSTEELMFLYEVQINIQSFGYGADPRIRELIGKRSFPEDIDKIYEYFISNPDISMPQKVVKMKKISKNINQIMQIEQKMDTDQELSPEELIFLYEVNDGLEPTGLYAREFNFWRRFRDLVWRRHSGFYSRDVDTMYEYFSKEANMPIPQNLIDTRKLQLIGNKLMEGQNLSNEELRFIYELDNEIQLLRSGDHFLLEEIRKQRNVQEDLPVIFDCEPEQIVSSASAINENTQVYIGKLEQGIFEKIGRFKIEYVYTSFPDKRVKFDQVTSTGKTGVELIAQMKAEGLSLRANVEKFIKSRDFSTSVTPGDFDLVVLSASGLGISSANFSINRIYEKAEKLGLQPVPPELGIYYRLKNKDKPLHLFMGMNPIISGSIYGFPRIFYLTKRNISLWPDKRSWWKRTIPSNNEFAFVLPTATTKNESNS
jgi:hypothetical protein